MRKKVIVESHALGNPRSGESVSTYYMDKWLKEMRLAHLVDSCVLQHPVPTATGRLVRPDTSYLLDNFQAQSRVLRKVKKPEIRYITTEMDFSEIEKRVKAAANYKQS